MKTSVKLWSTTLFLTAATSCAHRSEEEKLARSYEHQAAGRISAMESNAKGLEKRAGQLLGTPRAELTGAIDSLNQEISQSKAELGELRKRSEDTWLEKKQSVDRELYEMDQAYSAALRVLEAH